MISKDKDQVQNATLALEHVKKEITIAVSSGIDVSKAKDLLNQAKISLENKAYTQVITITSEALKLLKGEKHEIRDTKERSEREMYELAISSLMKCQKKLESAKKGGLETDELNKMLESTRPLLRKKRFKEAVDAINDILSVIDKDLSNIDEAPGKDMSSMPPEPQVKGTRTSFEGDEDRIQTEEDPFVETDHEQGMTREEPSSKGGNGEGIHPISLMNASVQNEKTPIEERDENGPVSIQIPQRNVTELFEKVGFLLGALERKGDYSEDLKTMYKKAIRLHSDMISHLETTIEKIHTHIGDRGNAQTQNERTQEGQAQPDGISEIDAARELVSKVEEGLITASDFQVNVVPIRNLLKKANDRIEEGGEGLLDDVTKIVDEAKKKVEDLIFKHHKKTSGEKLLYLKTLALESKSRGVDISDANEKLKLLRADVEKENFENFEERVKQIEDGLTHAKATHHQKAAETVLKQAEKMMKDALLLKLKTDEAGVTLQDAMEAFNKEEYKRAEELATTSYEKIEALITMKSDEIQDEANELMQNVETTIQRFRDDLPDDSPLIEMAYEMEDYIQANDVVSAFVLMAKLAKEAKDVEEKYLGQRLKESLMTIDSTLKRAKELQLDTTTEVETLEEIKELSSHDLDKAQKLAKELEEAISKDVTAIVDEQKRKAEESKILCKSIIEGMSIAGADVSKAESLFEGLKSAFDDQKFSKAVEIGKEIEKEVKGLEHEYLKNVAEKPLKLAESKVVFAKERGIEPGRAKEILEEAKRAFTSGEFDRVEYLAKKVMKSLDEEEAKKRAQEKGEGEKKDQKAMGGGQEVDVVEKVPVDGVDVEALQQLAMAELRSAREVVMGAKAKGLDISEAESVFLGAKPAMTEGRFQDAIDIARRTATLVGTKATQIANDDPTTASAIKDTEEGLSASNTKVDVTKREVYDALKSVKELMLVVREKGVDVSDVEELFIQAQPAVKNQDFSKAYEIAIKAKRRLEDAGEMVHSMGESGKILSNSVQSDATGQKDDDKKNLVNTLFKPI